MSEASEALRKKLIALKAKTTSAGCTEAEAMAAAELAARLMAEHGLSDEDLIMTEDFSHTRRSAVGPFGRLWGTIGVCTNTAPVVEYIWNRWEVRFYGQEPGPEIAIYLMTVCERAVASEQSAFRKSAIYSRKRNTKTRRAAMEEFTDAMIQRLRVRLYDVFGAAINDAALVAARRHREGRTAGQTKTLVHKKRPARITAATVSGWEAGDRPQIARGVNGKAATASAFLEGPEA